MDSLEYNTALVASFAAAFNRLTTISNSTLDLRSISSANTDGVYLFIGESHITYDDNEGYESYDVFLSWEELLNEDVDINQLVLQRFNKARANEMAKVQATNQKRIAEEKALKKRAARERAKKRAAKEKETYEKLKAKYG